MAIRDILFDIASELETADPAALDRVDRFVGYAAAEIDRAVWGEKADMATALLAAHKLTIGGRKGSNQGAVTAERVGDLSRSYAAPSKDSEYSSTSYGAELEALRATLCLGFIPL